MKKIAFPLLIMAFLFIFISSLNAVFFEHSIEKYTSTPARSDKGGYPLNTYILDTYNIVSYGYPHGNWMKSETGFMTKDNTSNDRGEYQFLGYNNREEPITNDRYFKSSDLTGKVFDKYYSGITWKGVEGSESKWEDLDYRSQIRAYILHSKFWDKDHITAGKEPTHYSISSFCAEKGIDYSTHALVMSEPTTNTTGVVKFNYIRNSDGHADYNTVEIPPLPHVKCHLKAYPNIKNIEKGKKADIIVTLDTSGSYAFLNNQEDENLTNRTYWASTGVISGSGSDSTQSTYQITVPQVSPNTVINVQARVYSQEVADLDMEELPPYDTATTRIFIGEIASPPPLDFTRPNTQAVIKADARDQEAFDVTKGIPSSETLYTQVVSEGYLYRLSVVPVSGTVTTTVTVNHLNDKGGPKTSVVTVPHHYTYWEIKSFELFSLKNAVIENDALPDNKVVLTPSAIYHAPQIDITHDPDDCSTYHVVTGGTSVTVSSSAISASEVQAAAESAASSPIVRSDELVIDGKVIMDADRGLVNASHTPSKIDRNVFYVPNLRIPDTKPNGSYQSKGAITYKRDYAYEPLLSSELTFDLENVNPVFVHTPVCVEAAISSDDIHNQKPNPTIGTSALILGRPFTVDIRNYGTHRNIKGYGSKDYTQYIKDREIRFDFDTYLGTNMEGAYLKANSWYSLNGLGITNIQALLTFYTPTWVDEGLHNVEIRNIALNDSSNGTNTENKANLNPLKTAAVISKTLEISGRVYDLTITDIDDAAWETFFRKAKGSAESTGRRFFTGKSNINGDLDAQRKYVFPVMPGKNDVTGYQDRAVKLGYAVKFELKTMGNYYDPYDFVRIMPTFAFVDKAGKNRQGVDLYYSTPQNPLVRVGSAEDILTQTMKLDFKYRGIPLSEFIKTAEAMFRLRGGIQGFTLDQWREDFPKISQSGVVASKYFKILLSEPVRSFIGPERGIPEGVDSNKALASVQRWYGEYRLPADCLAVPKGTDLSKQRNLTRSSPVFLKDGYILVSFKDIAVINNDHFEAPSLQYTGKTGDGWALEGYNPDQGGWQLMSGDMLSYYVDQRATDDITGTGTH